MADREGVDVSQRRRARRREIDDSLKQHTLNVLADLDQRTAGTPTDYDLVQAAALLRQLLLERLAQDANREARLRIVYTVADHGSRPPIPEALELHARYVELDPEHAPSHWLRKELTQQAFLSFRLITVAQADYSVADIIRLGANVLGGVHLGPPDSPRLEPLRRVNAQVTVMGRPLVAAHLLLISRATVRALDPLHARLARELGQML